MLQQKKCLVTWNITACVDSEPKHLMLFKCQQLLRQIEFLKQEHESTD